MPTGEAHIRHGFGAVRPYLHGHLDLSDFVKHVFGAAEIERVEMGPKSFHVESQIGDSVVVLETGNPPASSATLASVYVYVEDVDAAYRRAIEFGAVSIAEPEDKPYQERSAGVKDSFGNTWWISTYKPSR
ncbi:MAG TPA: VOC family protein [Isosphaeraceae bacterium]|jgi:PhnB protein|nr:VOC family protein [Isosphaeraceae bacterium]